MVWPATCSSPRSERLPLSCAELCTRVYRRDHSGESRKRGILSLPKRGRRRRQYHECGIATRAANSLDSRVMIRVLAVDDHPVVRTGIRAMIANESDMSVVAEA